MSEFYERLAQAVGAKAPEEVQMAPRLDPKRMANAVKWAPFGQEHPLLFVDNSVFNSGKAGVLVTSHALYFDSPATRIELQDIGEPPTYPEGLTKRGRLRTRRGEVQLPHLLSDDTARIVKNVLEAIVAFNHGAHRASSLRARGPIDTLAHQLLRHGDVHLAPNLPRNKLRNAAAAFADWVDHASGERPIAYIDETTFGKGSEGVLLTDRRLLSYTYKKQVMIPYGAITKVSTSSGLMSNKLHVDAGPHSAAIELITCADAVEPLALFFRGLLQIPPHQRWEPALVPPATAQDPSGAFGLLPTLDPHDARIPILLRYVGEMARRGAMPPALAADFVTRIQVLHRTLAHGRGMAQGRRLSPLQSADFHYMLGVVFGDPVSVSPSQQPSDPYRGAPGPVQATLDFTLGPRPNVAGVATAAVGLALLAGVGVGWLSSPKSTLQRVRVTTTDLPSSTGFAPLGMTEGRFEPLAELAPGVFDQLLGALANLEALLLFYRIVFGWGPFPQQLLQWGAELSARVTQALGPTDLTAFDRVE